MWDCLYTVLSLGTTLSLGKEGVDPVTNRREQRECFEAQHHTCFSSLKLNYSQLNNDLQTDEAYRRVVLSNIYKYIPLWFGGTAYKSFKSWITT